MEPCTEYCTKATTGSCALCEARAEAERFWWVWFCGGLVVEGWRFLAQREVFAVLLRRRWGMAWLVAIGSLWLLPQAPWRETTVLHFVETHGLFLVGLGGSLGVLGLWLLLWKVPQWQTTDVLERKDQLDLETKARQSLAQIVGGAALLLGLYFTSQTLNVSREGQITDRFTKAITQLGDDKLDIRLGGIYALERLAKDSAADLRAVMEVLTAFVREHSGGRAKTFGTWLFERVLSIEHPQEPTAKHPPTDIQAILTIIGRPNSWWGRGERRPFDLRNTVLQGANLLKAHLEGAYLWEAHLEGAYLWEAHLEGAKLEGADLRNVIGLTQPQLDTACVNASTQLPPGLTRPPPCPQTP